MLVTLRLVQVCPAVVPQFFTTWAHPAQYATYAHAFLLGFFVTVENKRFVNPTPKRSVAAFDRAGVPFLSKSGLITTSRSNSDSFVFEDLGYFHDPLTPPLLRSGLLI